MIDNLLPLFPPAVDPSTQNSSFWPPVTHRGMELGLWWM